MPGYELETTAVQDRLNGYRRALEAEAMAYNEDLVWLDLYEKRSPLGVVNESYQAALLERLENYQPTAIIAINDLIADCLIHDLLVIQSSQMRSAFEGLSEAPGFDLELAIFDNHLPADSSYLSVVAVHPTLELGRSAANSLLTALTVK